MKSTCCLADLKVEPRPELYHGCDDDYELVIPFLVCTKCGKVQLTAVETEKSRQTVPIGGVKEYA